MVDFFAHTPVINAPPRPKLEPRVVLKSSKGLWDLWPFYAATIIIPDKDTDVDDFMVKKNGVVIADLAAECNNHKVRVDIVRKDPENWPSYNLIVKFTHTSDAVMFKMRLP